MAMDKYANGVIHAGNASSLVEVLERVLDKGIVVAGDIKLKIVDIELLTIQIRLMVCSVDKAREIGMNWWMTNAYIGNSAATNESLASAHARDIERLDARVKELEGLLSAQLTSPDR